MKPAELPTNREIREEIQLQAHLYEGPGRYAELREIRFQVLQLMREISILQPRLTTATLGDHLLCGSNVQIHVLADGPEFVQSTLDELDITYTVDNDTKEDSKRTYALFYERVGVQLTIDLSGQTQVASRDSTPDSTPAGCSLCEFEQLMDAEYGDCDWNTSGKDSGEQLDHFSKFRVLMLPLEMVHQNRKRHPEGDALYHSLQVFDLARDELPYDEEFLLAALLHDVGKAIDPSDHVQAGLDVLNGFISDRSAWLIANHPLAHSYRDGTIGARALRRIRRSDDFDELMLLGQCDRKGRVAGVDVPDLDDALDYIRQLDSLYD
jgi:hypothetical protein